MTSRERVLEALAHRPTDRVPANYHARGAVCVAWSEDGEIRPLEVPTGMRVLDLMGNPRTDINQVDGTPVYLVQ